MNIEPKPATTKGSAEWFIGDVWVDSIATPRDDDQRMIVSRVRFAPGAHTAWHAHGRGQTLHVTEGVALLGTRDGTVIRATPGQTIYTPPGQEHWHGATPDDFMEHLAMLEDAEGARGRDGWFEHVADEEYRAAADS
jgi:quercetin dioxygenase-like cupin family protein